MTEEFTGWETTRLSKHFILLDFMADHAVYRHRVRLPFGKTWDREREQLAKGLCAKLLEPLIEACGPISIADAFWPDALVERSKKDHYTADGPKHRWKCGEATVDVALYRLVDEGKQGAALRRAVQAIETIDGCRDRVISYLKTEFVCVTFKEKNAKTCGSDNTDKRKAQKLRPHHVRVGRYFNLLDFCRSSRALKEGINLVPKGAESKNVRGYSPVPEETAARAFAAALDPLVHELGRISVVRGIETAELPATDEHADFHRWDQDGPWRLVFVLPQGTDPDKACELLKRHPHVCPNVEKVWHPSCSWSLALVVDPERYNQKLYKEYRGFRLICSD